MPEFTGKLDRTVTVNASKEDTMALMTNPEAFKVHLDNLQKMEKISEDTFRLQLKELSEKGVSFRGDYTVKYAVDGDRFTWRTTSRGNMNAVGSIIFRALGDTRTQVRYNETIMCDMKVNRLVAKVLKPIVERAIAKGIGTFLDNMKRGLE